MAETSNSAVDELLPAQLVDQRISITGDNQSSRPKIQRVPAFLRQKRDFAEYYTPMIISFGPIHHRNENLRLGQQLKNQWASLYIQEYIKTNNTTGNPANFLLKIVEDRIGELKKLFAEDVIKGYNDKELAEMLFVDGCSLLYFMEHNDHVHPEELNLKPDLFIYIQREIAWLLENQLPMSLLELLSKKQGDDMEFLLLNFHERGTLKRGESTSIKISGPKPTHILEYGLSRFIAKDFFRDNIAYQNNNADDDTRSTSFSGGRDVWPSYKNIRDLKKAGIRVKKNQTEVWKWYNISFTSGWFSGELRLPVFMFNQASPYSFRNMIAYEMCPDNYRSKLECCSYFSFMDSLIDGAEDVKELRLARAFLNGFGSDEELAEFFNEIGRDLPTQVFNYEGTEAVAYSKRYIEVQRQMEKHYTNKWKTWLAEGRSTYFNTPWSLIGLLAALLALVLTFIQTWYAVRTN